MNQLLLNSNELLILSPLDQFEVKTLVAVYAPVIGPVYLTITNLGLFAGLSLATIGGLFIFGDNEFAIVPSRWSIALETIYETLKGIVMDNLGHGEYLPFIVSVFLFILIVNLTGNIPYTFAATSSLIFSIGLSVMAWIAVTLLGLFLHRVKFFSFFLPNGTPLALAPLLSLIEFISYTARAFSLGIRLWANIVAGHALIAVLSGFLYTMFTSGIIMFFVTLVPFSIFLAISGLELAVSVIQAYVFTLLLCSYLKDSIELH